MLGEPLRAAQLGPAIVLMVAAISCSNGGDQADTGDESPDGGVPSSTVTPDETAFAQAMLLNLSDFPTGWAEDKSDIGEESPFDKCDMSPENPPGRTGRAETGDFSNDASSSISESLAVFSSPAQISDQFDLITSKRWADCLVQVVSEGELNNDEVEFSDAIFSEMSFPDFGDRTDARRLEMHYKRTDQTGFGSEGSVFIDLVSVTIGRVGFSIQASDVLTPYDSAELESYVAKAEAKVRQRLP